MSQIDHVNYSGVYEHIKERLYSNLDSKLYYHGPHHTFEDVIPASEKLSQWENLNEQETLIVKTAALFHDTGFLEQYERNEPIGCRIAQETLPKYGYTQEMIDRICNCIMATQLPQNPQGDHLAMIVCDSDLAHLGSELYFIRSEYLRMELNARSEKRISPRAWNLSNIRFLRNHHYWTQSAKERFDPEKEENLKETFTLLGIDEDEKL